MNKYVISTLGVAVLASVTLAVNAQLGPIADKIADKVIQKYQTETCQQIAANKAAPPNDMQKKAVDELRRDPQLRQAFLNKVAGPIVNKLFECGMIP